MRGQEKLFDKEEIKVILEYLGYAVVLVAALLMALYIIIYQGRSAELQNTGMLASTLGGAVTALASAPDKGVYCVMMPGTLGYYIVLGKADLPGIGVRSFISAYSPEKSATGISYLPLSGFTPGSVHVPSGKPYVVAFRKAGPSSPVTMEAVEGTVDMANCDTMAATPTLRCNPNEVGYLTSKPCICGASTCGDNYCCNGRTCSSSPCGASQLNVAVVLLKDMNTCVVGDTYTSGGQCTLQKIGDIVAVKTYQKNANFKGVKPADAGSYQVSQCIHTTLDASEISNIKNNIVPAVVNEINAASGGSIVLNPIYYEVGGDVALTGVSGCALNLAPADIKPFVDTDITKDTDFIFVFHKTVEAGTNIFITPTSPGLTTGMAGGINGAGYSVITNDAFNTVTVYHEWLHQLESAYRGIMKIPDIYADNFPQSLCGNADPNAYKWLPGIHSWARDPDFSACVSHYDDWGGYCTPLYPAVDCNDEWNKHVVSAHYNKTISLIGNHCRDGRQDAWESGVDVGGTASGGCTPASTPTPIPAGGTSTPTATPVGGTPTPTATPVGGTSTPTPTPVGGTSTPTPTPVGGTSTPTPTASGIVISGEGGDITI